jgi:beta-galactosidase
MASRSGTIDINGVRRPISFWREIVWNLRSEPYIAVHRPQGYGRELRRSRWAWDDVLSSWAWDVPDGTPVTIDVYADAEEVELVLNGSPVATAAIAPDTGGGVPAHVARFETTFRAGELVAVARRAGAEVGRTAVRSLTSEPRLRVRAERHEVDASSADLVFAHVELRDEAGTLAVERHDRIRVEVTGPGILVALSSAKPDDEEGFDGDSHQAFEGRLLAIVRDPDSRDKLSCRRRRVRRDHTARRGLEDSWPRNCVAPSGMTERAATPTFIALGCAEACPATSRISRKSLSRTLLPT